MTDITRRRLAAQAAALGAALAFGRSCATPIPRQVTERRDLYPQGVASGDPAPDSIILWTRRAPDEGVASHHLAVEVASDEAFSRVVARGEVDVSAQTDWTCRFLAAGLRPAREYWYRFIDEAGNASRVGRTLTAPADNDARPVRFAFVSCQDVTIGALNAYRRMIHEDVHRPRAEQLGFVLHLGDFIYELVKYPENGTDGRDRGRRLRDIVRYPNGKTIRNFTFPTDLGDYRTIYRAYLTDPDLQDARARWPFVPVWDNHEFSWNGFQSQSQIFNDAPEPAQNLKMVANQAWYEYQPARVIKPGAGDVFEAPAVTDTPLTDIDARGVSHEPNNQTAINALRIYRAFRFGANVDMIITDNRSYKGVPNPQTQWFEVRTPPNMTDEAALDIIDQGREYNGGNPPATIRFGNEEVPNECMNAPPDSYLGLEQMAWFRDRLRSAQAPWKIWGHSWGTLTLRADPQNLPAEMRERWPGDGYALIRGGYAVEHGEIFDMVRQEGITGLTIVAGDRHSFWAGYPCKTLPPRDFDPVGIEFITGSITAQGHFEVVKNGMAADHPYRALYLYDPPDGPTQCATDMTILHGVRSSLMLRETGDVAAARAVRNPDLSPNLTFADNGGHGYATVRASPDELETEFVCIPIPFERAETEDGGPLRYRAVHRARLWAPDERPQMSQEIVEGSAPLSTT